jgi:hypothetical protein
VSRSLVASANRDRALLAKPFTGVLQQVLCDGDIYERRVNVSVAEIRGKVWQTRLWINAVSVPSQHAVENKAVAEVMNTRSDLTVVRLYTRASEDPNQQLSRHDLRVSSSCLLVPEERRGRLSGRACLFANF